MDCEFRGLDKIIGQRAAVIRATPVKDRQIFSQLRRVH